MISKLAAEHLGAEYRETTTELTTLEHALADLQGKIEAKRIKAEWLKSQLEGVKPLLVQPIPPTTVEFPVSPPTIPVSNGYAESSENGTQGLRYHIRAVLKDIGRGMRPKDVHGELIKRAVSFGEGKKSSSMVRTYNELYRMSRIGQIRKRGSLFYQQDTH